MQEDEQFQEARLSYQLTQLQQNAFNALVRAADDIMDSIEAASDRIEAVNNRTKEVEEARRLESIGSQESQERESQEIESQERESQERESQEREG